MADNVGGPVTSEASPVTYAVVDGVATVTLARPERRNALDAAALEALLAALARAADDEHVRAVVLTGSGTTFCSGADLKRAGDDGEGFAGRAPRLMAQVLETLLDHPKPTIARVQGHVAGGGNGLVAACDLAVAVGWARFAFSEVRVGVAPAVIAVVCLRVMPPRQAAELLLTGERVDAARALAAGLLTEVVGGLDGAADGTVDGTAGAPTTPELPDLAELDAAVTRWTDRLRLGGPQALAATKQLLRRVPSMSRDEAFVWTSELSAALFASEEAAEGMAAFAARRPPSWAPPA